MHKKNTNYTHDCSPTRFFNDEEVEMAPWQIADPVEGKKWIVSVTHSDVKKCAFIVLGAIGTNKENKNIFKCHATIVIANVSGSFMYSDIAIAIDGLLSVSNTKTDRLLVIADEEISEGLKKVFKAKANNKEFINFSLSRLGQGDCVSIGALTLIDGVRERRFSIDETNYTKESFKAVMCKELYSGEFKIILGERDLEKERALAYVMIGFFINERGE